MSHRETASWDDHPCENPIEHRPKPLRTVAHHVQPESAGGKDGPQIWVCDVDHYNIHRLLRMLRDDTPMGREGDPFERRVAAEGYGLCIAAGTVDQIPNEG